MRIYSRLSSTSVLTLVMFIIQVESIKYAAVLDERESVLTHDRSNSAPLWQSGRGSEIRSVPMKVFPKPSDIIIRRKRDWVIPPVSIPENDKGPFPKRVVQMKSTASIQMLYKITGTGVDQPPRGLFIVDKTTGWLSVTKKLDREETKEYIIQINALSVDHSYTETPIDIIIKIIDQNDNKPHCTQNPFTGHVLETAKLNEFVIQVTAEDQDDPETANSIVRYKLVRQDPHDVFHIDSTSGVISLASTATLDRETHPVYTLEVEAADMEGHGLSSTCMVTIKVTDSNDNPPRFSQRKYAGTVQENKAGEIVARLLVIDKDEPLTANSLVKFTITEGNEEGFFTITPNKMEGILSTEKGLDFERFNSFSLLVEVENEAPITDPLLPTSTATVTITVEDVNEPPIFEPTVKRVTVAEDLTVGSIITRYTAKDPDTAREQNIRYKLLKDSAAWLNITEDTGHVRVRSPMDREGHFVREGQYSVLILAYDDDDDPATGTATLVIELSDVNDNPPVLNPKRVQMCSTEPKPIRLTITDSDAPENSAPFTAELPQQYRSNWIIATNSSSGVVMLSPVQHLAVGEYHLSLHLRDSQMLFQNSSVSVEVCDCEGDGENVTCIGVMRAAYISPFLISVLVAIFCLLVLLLLLLLLLRRKSHGKQKKSFLKEEARDNIEYYNEEGGGEEDQDYDMDLLHRGPEVYATDVAPTVLPTVCYRPLREADEDVGNFIFDNLCTADDDHYVAPYDSLLVFGYEGDGSDAGSLSSLRSSSSAGDQDYQQLQHWGPRFSRLADMYAGGEEE